MHKATPVLLFALLLAPCVSRASNCPLDTILVDAVGYMSNGLHVSTDPTLLFSDFRFYDAPATTATQRGEYDLIQGRIEAAAHGTSVGNMYMLHADVTVATHDLYQLVGPTGGVPVTFSARLRLNVLCAGESLYDIGIGEEVVHSGFVEASLGEEGANNRTALRVDQDFRGVRELSLPLVRSVGESFGLRMALRAEGTAHPNNTFDTGDPRYAEAAGRLSFPDLPAGYAIVSCQGFSSDVVVSARKSTWGRIKSMYR